MTFFSTALAVVSNPALDDNLQGQDSVFYLTSNITKAMNIIFIVAAIAFIFMFVIGGVQWMMAGGDKGSVESARMRIIHALTGIVVLFLTFAIARLVEGIFGVQILTLDLAPVLNR